MPISIARRTLLAIDQAIASDQGARFRYWQGQVMPHLPDAYRAEEESFRSHLGASTIGRDCARELWYGFRWATVSKHSAQLLRLFNRGHLEEGRFIAMLLTIGAQVYQTDANGKQYRISAAGGHYGGSGDGVFVGCPDLEAGVPALSEFKTYNAKTFAKLAGDNWDEWYAHHILGQAPKTRKVPEFKGEGVRNAKFEHYVQMQQYMRKMGLNFAVYFAVNKDNDHIYAELVVLDVETADRYLHRGEQIVFMQQAPARINESPTWFGCKFCDHRQVCHYGAAPARNCRTCEWSIPAPDGTWHCSNRRVIEQRDAQEPTASGTPVVLSKAVQLTGCSMWAKHSTAFR